MTMRPIFLATTVVFAMAASAFAQPVVFPPAPPVPAVPAAPVPAPFPAVSWTPQEIHIPEFHSHEFQIPEIHMPTVEHITAMAMAQAEKAVTAIGSGKGEPFQIYAGAQSGDAAYSQAQNYIDRNQYDRALEPLDRVISAKGERAVGAMYWKAYSLMKLARRDEALSTLGQLTKQFPDSPWVRDARALEVEVKQAAGQNAATDAVDDETKLLALQGIMRTDPDAAIPAVEKMLAGGGSVRLKDRALFVLSQSRSDKALGIISNVARVNTNPDLQQRAIRYLGQSNTADSMKTLSTVYGGSSSVDVKKAVISALASSRNPAAVTTLVALARAERNPELKNSIVRHLSNSNAPEAKGLMLEILSK